MRFLRVVKRLLLLGLVTVTMFCSWMTLRWLTRNSREKQKYWRNRTTRTWARGVARVIGMRLVPSGVPPAAPFFLVANHLSYLDIINIASQLDCVFIAKSDIAQWPVVGMLAKSVDTIFVDRAHFQDIPRVITRIERAMNDGYGIVLFPEGTSTKGDQVLPFRPGLLEPAARLGLPVSLATISYRTPPQEKPAFLSVCWWGEMTFLSHFLQMLRLDSFDAILKFGDTPFCETDRKVLARRLWEKASTDFVPIITDQGVKEVAARNPEYFPARY
ncbi:MAG: lysophospholipid acyltransferase family protein [Acidobacteriota bacterium]